MTLKIEVKNVLVVNSMNILDASILFTRASNVRTQLDYISGNDSVIGEDLRYYNNMIRFIDKIYMSPNTRENRGALQKFILSNSDEIYRKYIALTESSLSNDPYDDRDKIDFL